MTIAGERPDRLYELLPAVYRIADAARGEPLRALLALIAEEADAVREDTRQLWDDFFIETCRPWVVPYIGDLVAATPLHDLDPRPAAATAESVFVDLTGPDLRATGALRTRADVAKTISYRRRKGTPAMLEELAQDVTGWSAHVVEFFTLLDWQQHLEHLRPDRHGCPDLRRIDTGDRAGGPWDTTPHTVDVRPINEWDGWHNIPNLGFFVWRLHAHRLTNVTPRRIGTTWQLTFSPLGNDAPLFSAGRERGASRVAIEQNVEAPIRPVAFSEDPAGFYGDPSAGASVEVSVKGEPEPVDVAAVRCLNLATWPAVAPTDSIGIDVARGRLVAPTAWLAKGITVTYHHGFGAPLGGGEYDRRKWLVREDAPQRVSGGADALETALGAPRAAQTVIEIADSATYPLAAGSIKLGPGEQLTIQAADGARPHVQVTGGTLSIAANASAKALTLGGLAVEGALAVTGGLERLRLLHSTLVPMPGVPSVDALAASNAGLEIQVAWSITGALRIPERAERLWLLDSIVDGAGGDAVDGGAGKSGPPAHIERSTLFGAGRFLKLPLASETIFAAPVVVEQRQQGCARFSYVPTDSSTPQQYRCQPALEIARQVERIKRGVAERPPGRRLDWETLVAEEVASWLVASFESERYGRPDYARLRRSSPPQVRTGAEDGSEMGVFCGLREPQRASNLALRLEEYLPVGLDAGIVYVT